MRFIGLTILLSFAIAWAQNDPASSYSANYAYTNNSYSSYTDDPRYAEYYAEYYAQYNAQYTPAPSNAYAGTYDANHATSTYTTTTTVQPSSAYNTTAGYSPTPSTANLSAPYGLQVGSYPNSQLINQETQGRRYTLQFSTADSIARTFNHFNQELLTLGWARRNGEQNLFERNLYNISYHNAQGEALLLTLDYRQDYPRLVLQK